MMKINDNQAYSILSDIESALVKLEDTIWSFITTRCFKDIDNFEYLRRQIALLIKNVVVFKDGYVEPKTIRKGVKSKRDNTNRRRLQNRKKR